MTIRIDDDLMLRTYQPYDAPELFSCVANNRAHLREFLPWVNTTLSQEDSSRYIHHCLLQETSQAGLSMGIFQNNLLVGSIGFHDWNHLLMKAQLGYWLIKEVQGQGLMQRVAVKFISFLFNHLGMNKVEIHFLPYNTRSSALTKHLGAKVEGVLRDSVKLNGSFEDVVITGILKKEWRFDERITSE